MTEGFLFGLGFLGAGALVSLAAFACAIVLARNLDR